MGNPILFLEKAVAKRPFYEEVDTMSVLIAGRCGAGSANGD